VNRYFARLSLTLLGTALLVPALHAQGRGAFFHPPARTGHTFSNAPRANGFRHVPGARFPGRFARGFRYRHLYPYGYGSYWPYFYEPDSDYDDGSADDPTPAPRTAAPAPRAENSKAADSVVMELRGDHWVRLTSTGPVEVLGRASASSPANSSSGDTNSVVLPAFYSSPAPAPLPAAVLIFRDGHQEEISKYTIVGRTIYLKSDYWSTGSWTRKILIADLDIPATLKLNADRGTKFALPSRSSEVILRP